MGLGGDEDKLENGGGGGGGGFFESFKVQHYFIYWLGALVICNCTCMGKSGDEWKNISDVFLFLFVLSFLLAGILGIHTWGNKA